MSVPETRDSGQELPLPWDDTAQELYEHAPCGYLTTLPDGTVVNVNETFLSWTGYGRADLVGRKRLRDLLGVGSLIYYETHVAPLLRMQGEVREIALDVRCATGRRMPTLVNATLNYDADGAERVIRVTVFDATERRRYEAELLQARRTAEESERRVRVLQQVVADLAAVPTASGVARAVVAAAGPAFGAADGGLWVVDGDRKQLVLAAAAAHAGFRDVALSAAGAAATVVRRGEPVVLAGAAKLRTELPEWAPALLRQGRQGALLVPLTAHEAVLGVLVCTFTEAHAVSDSELQLARLLGQQAGQALDRARLYDEVRLREERAVFLGEVSRDLDGVTGLAERARLLAEMVVRGVAAYAQVRLAGEAEVLAEAGEPAATGTDIELPLTVRGAVAATLTLRPHGGLPVPDPAFLAELADRAAPALENARLYEREREVARTLQRSLLAGEPPGDLRFTVEACYRPAGGGLEVGGDWHDAFLITPDRLAVVVGDVVGRGLHAASTMGQLRSAVRALAAAEAGPARLVEQLDRFVDRVETARMATVAYAEIALDTGTMTYCCAGHPPPLLLPAHADPETLWEGRSAPLGSRAGRRSRAEATVRLVTGDRVLLYTDGLVERRDRHLDEGLDRLAAMFATRRRSPMKGLTARIADAMLMGGEPPDDDVCLLCVSLGTEPRLERTIPADPYRIKAVRTDLKGWLEFRGVDEDSADALLLALSEAVANAIEHGYRDCADGTVTVTATQLGDEVILRVADKGTWREPRPDDPARGRGLFLIGKLTDQMEINTDGGTTVTMRRQVAGG
ncbi:SpoIIE family protein phosphatase [Spirilliplanes yamanashiensis]|uniref:PAS domain-containing protein n=1 Tax=Spirilliplanes yamanashiensis TaxID=42233 RepID=A0A8J3YCE1_9ACTN|nr:SpoIIE family protein phosphatase [Spirilliplanes yamanashiensis]MDP9816461.1 serine/threonine-protein kinase RsbW [Spirilliplanes yamanashiensis]GIJ05988.1 hypothetical protein Sya03_53400 [Spirilliplanes yamanashiensis]